MGIQKCRQVELLPLGDKAIGSTAVDDTSQRTVSKKQLQTPTKHNGNKRKTHRTGDGGLCYGSIRIIGLDHSFCSVCEEWIPTRKMVDKSFSVSGAL